MNVNYSDGLLKYKIILANLSLKLYLIVRTFSTMNKSRHAYCIIAHTDYYCLSRLVELVDDERNDIFLLFDKKSSIRKMSLPETFNSRIFTLPESQLIDIQWGGCRS